jgi:hypothetical protein
MPNFNKHTKQWTYTVEEQSKHDLDEDGNDLIYMDDEENNFGQEYEYGSEEDSEEDEEVVESSLRVISFRNKSRRRYKKSSEDSDSEDFDSEFYKEMEANQKQIHAQAAGKSK